METRSIHFKSDFLVRLMNEVDWSTPFSIRFFTTRAVSAKVVAFDGENYVGCTLDESTGALLVPFERFTELYRQGLGTLRMELTYRLSNALYPDQYQDVVLPAQPVVCTNDQQEEFYLSLGLTGDDDVEVSASVVAPFMVGPQGAAGTGISTMVQTSASMASAGANVWKMTLTDGREFLFTVLNGEKGDTGAQGPQGPQGPQGAKGDKGDKGDTGARGPQGEQGPRGVPGQKGEKGAKGDKGDRGLTGESGPAGSTPLIGQNGNWWVGGTDTGVKADYSGTEAQRQETFEANEADRQEEFDSKEATRDAANQAALDCADTLAALGQKVDGSDKNYKTGKCYISNGSLSASSNGAYEEEYIPVSPGDTIVWHSGCDSSVASFSQYSLIQYDESKSRFAFKLANSQPELTFSTPAGGRTRYIRACFNKNALSECFISVNGVVVWRPQEAFDGHEQRITALEAGIDEKLSPSDVVNDFTIGGASVPSSAETVKTLAQQDSAMSASIDTINSFLNGKAKNYKTGYCYLQDGTKSASTNGAYEEDYIPVNAGDTIIWHSGCDDSVLSFEVYALIQYNESKTRIGFKVANSQSEITFSIPSNGTTRFVRACFNVNVLSECFIKVNGTKVWEPQEEEKGIKEKTMYAGLIPKRSMFDFTNREIADLDISDIVSNFDVSGHSELVFSQVSAIFDGLVTNYPNLVTRQDAGELAGLTYPSYANLDGETSPDGVATPTYRTYMYKFSIGGTAKRKKLLFVGGTHGLEYLGPIDLAVLASRICSMADPNLARILIYFDLYIIPCLNGYGMINHKRTNGNAVDINRNYPTSDWELSGEGTVTYSGPSAGSEFETQLIMGVVDEISPSLVLDHHNYDSSNRMNFYTKVPQAIKDAAEIAKTDLCFALLRDYPQYFGNMSNSFASGLLRSTSSPDQESTPGSTRNWVAEQGLIGILIETTSVMNYNGGAYDTSIAASTYYKPYIYKVAYYTLMVQILRYIEFVLD